MPEATRNHAIPADQAAIGPTDDPTVGAADDAVAVDPRGAPPVRARGTLGIWAELTKVRLNALVLGFATTAAMWAIGYVAMLAPGLWIGEA
ncbi:MAG: hypothetical protein ACK5C3_03115, partial [bacterium]